MKNVFLQLEDAEFARSAAIKAKQNSELELADVQIQVGDSFYICHEFLTMMRLPPLDNNNNNNCQLDDVMRCKHETEERNLRLTREKADLTSSLAENEEELQEVMSQ